jgi:hypothetical protein
MRKATFDDIKEISEMLYSMYNEVQPELASQNIKKYETLAKEHLMNDFAFIDDNNRSLLIMRDVSIPVLDQKMYDGVSVYIKPEFRKTKLLKQMYSFMFKNFKGTIVGYTDINSEHNEVLVKRHKLLGFFYEINRGEE